MNRREILKYAGLLTVGSQISHAVGAQSSEPTWPMFQFDSANTGYNPDASIATEQVGQQWRTSTLGEVVASPIIDDGLAFVGSRDGKVYAMDLENGNIQWEYNIGDPIESTPAVSNGSIYVGSAAGNVYSLSTDGDLNWEFETDYPEILSSIITDGDQLYFLSGEWDDFDGWSDGEVHSLSLDRGEEVWNHSLISSFPHTPAIDSGKLYTFGIGGEDNANGSVIAINTTDGAVDWSGGESMGGGITVNSGSVYVSSGNTYALDTSDGSIQWEYNYPELEDSWVYSSAAVKGRSIYITVTSGSDFGFVYELDAVTGERTSRIRLLDEIRSSPILSDEFLYVGTEGGTVHGVSRTDLEEKWSFSTGGPVRSTPALIEDSLYVGSDDGYVYSLGRVDETSQNQTPIETNTETPMPPSEPQTTPTQPTTQAPSNTSTDEVTATPTTTDDAFERGFFTNGRESPFSFLNNPFVLTVGGFFLSVFGIVYQLVEGD